MSAAAAMSWHHAIAGYEAPTKLPRVVTLLAGARRLLAAPARRMEPASLAIVRRIVGATDGSTDIGQQRLAFYVVVAFFGFLRYSDMRRLCVKHFSYTDHLTVHLPQSKTDQFRKGSELLIAALPGRAYCPFVVSRRFIERLKAVAMEAEKHSFL